MARLITGTPGHSAMTFSVRSKNDRKGISTGSTTVAVQRLELLSLTHRLQIREQRYGHVLSMASIITFSGTVFTGNTTDKRSVNASKMYGPTRSRSTIAGSQINHWLIRGTSTAMEF